MSKALILEDSPGLQRVIHSKLLQEGYEVSGADNVNDALNLLGSNQDYTLFWIDHTLVGEATGLDFLSRIKEDKKYKDTPTILVTNLDVPEVLDEYTNLGIDKYYQKAHITISDVIDDIKKNYI